MKIVINNHRKIAGIQQEFSNMFPGLKIGFHAKPGKPGVAPSPKIFMHGSNTLQDCRAISRQGTIEILPTMSISELREHFRDRYGLTVEILQKGGNGAHEDLVGDTLSLEENSKQYSSQ